MELRLNCEKKIHLMQTQSILKKLPEIAKKGFYGCMRWYFKTGIICKTVMETLFFAFRDRGEDWDIFI